METVDIIVRKKNGQKLTHDEIRYMVDGYTDGTIPDYQMSSFLMAVCLRGLDEEETVDLTMIMKESGDVADLSAISGMKIDKHSTGGVGDKTTLILSPIAAACGVPVAKMSGRGLGFTGGTIDKLESIPGFSTTVEEKEFYRLVNDNGIAVIGQTAHIAPADKKIYALRDVTGTVDNISLITSSIMSKKLASGADGILLDVKCGKGAFMNNEEDAMLLAESMVRIGRSDGKIMRAIISDMDQPLGRAVGNSLEVREAIDVLKGDMSEDIAHISIELAGHMINMAGIASTPQEGVEMAKRAVEDGSALDKFKTFISGQGGDEKVVEDQDLMPVSSCEHQITADREGFVTSVDAMLIGEASSLTGAGRRKKEDAIDHGAGIYLEHKTGDRVKKGDVLCRLYSSDEALLGPAASTATRAYEIGDSYVEPPRLIKSIVE